jgi:hypothetical protein
MLSPAPGPRRRGGGRRRPGSRRSRSRAPRTACRGRAGAWARVPRTRHGLRRAAGPGGTAPAPPRPQQPPLCRGGPSATRTARGAGRHQPGGQSEPSPDRTREARRLPRKGTRAWLVLQHPQAGPDPLRLHHEVWQCAQSTRCSSKAGRSPPKGPRRRSALRATGPRSLGDPWTRTRKRITCSFDVARADSLAASTRRPSLVQHPPATGRGPAGAGPGPGPSRFAP